MALCTTEFTRLSANWPSFSHFVYPKKWTRIVSTINQEGCSYGSEYGLSQPVRCADFNSRNVSHLQNEFVQGKGGELQVTNNVSGMPRHYGTGRGQLPA